MTQEFTYYSQQDADADLMDNGPVALARALQIVHQSTRPDFLYAFKNRGGFFEVCVEPDHFFIRLEIARRKYFFLPRFYSHYMFKLFSIDEIAKKVDLLFNSTPEEFERHIKATVKKFEPR